MVLDGSVSIGAHGRMYHRRRTWHGATTDYLSPFLRILGGENVVGLLPALFLFLGRLWINAF